MNAHAPSGQEGAQRLRQRERRRLRDRVGRKHRHRGESAGRDDVDDRSAGTSQRREKRLRHRPGAEQVDGKVLVDRAAIAQIIRQRDAGVVDQYVDRFDCLGSLLNLRLVGQGQAHGRYARVRMD